MKKILVILLMLLCFASCKTMTLNQYYSLYQRYQRIDSAIEKLQFKGYLASEGYSEKEIYNITIGHIYIGMSERGLVGAWGEPLRINTTTLKSGTRKQYVYHNGDYVYTENGKVVAWQT